MAMWPPQTLVSGLGLLPLLLLSWLQLSSRISGVTAIQLQTCIDGFVVHRDKIIRAADSLKLGAEYLSNYEVSSKIECIKWCCDTDRCDVFVYEEKKLGTCYLFHCGPPHDFKCKFTNHVNYSSAVLTNYNLQSADAIDELNSLRKSEPVTSLALVTSTSSSSTTSTTTTSTTTSTTTNRPPSTSSEIVKLSSCSRNQFECRSSDDCIAIYNVCDGIPQCADGSDEALELGCPQERTSLPPPPPPPLPPQVQHPRPHQHQSAQQSVGGGGGGANSLPDLDGYQQMIQQHQQYPVRLYPPEGLQPVIANQETINGWSNYQPRGYAAAAAPPPSPLQQQQQPRPPNEPSGQGNELAAVAQQQQQQQQHQLLPPNYNQWQGPAAAGPARWSPVSLDEQKLAMAHPNHANAFQPDGNYPPQQQMPHIFNHKPAGGVRLEELETANGLYGQEPNRGYAPYYPAVIRHPESSWQETNNDNLAPPREGQQQQQQQQPANIARVPLATVAPPRQNVPYQEPKIEQQQQQQQQQRSTTSTTPPPCDSSENKQSADTNLASLLPAQMPHPKSSEQQAAAENGVQSKAAAAAAASAEHASQANDHKGHELELKSVAQAHLQEHKSITIVDHLARASHVSPRIEELEMSRPKGAVISLALGLSVTAIMAVLIACRMRVVKRRGRGRSHDSYAHDTDYLVNGMYL